MSLLLARLRFGEFQNYGGIAKIVSLIARDESQHLVLTQNIINKWRDGDDPDIVKIAKEEEQWTVEQFKRTVEEEKKRAEYLFKDGSIIGLNEKLLWLLR